MSDRLLHTGIVLLAVIALVGVFTLGVFSGRSRAQARIIVANATSLSEAFGYFHNDYDRYPTSVEFSQPGVMRTYLSKYPIEDFVSKICSRSFYYESSNFANYTFAVCVPQAYDGLAKGWNTVH